ncbi:pickpocket protein 19-like [Condylostylus longicornis]|uniref:pickpocket protein 19-like n=1 Tax=Condylostylus longicornis TaxID=2530218 RepID=UPI00244E5854|nr:pickpocket protein 19-like [Condylostylus longicornis]
MVQTFTTHQKSTKISIKKVNPQTQQQQQLGGTKNNDNPWNYWIQYLKVFCQRSAIHGISYLAEDNIHKFENSSFPVYAIQYPAVVLCSSNRLNWLRIDEAKKRFLPTNRSIEMENLFEKFFSKFESLKFGNVKKFLMDSGVGGEIPIKEIGVGKYPYKSSSAGPFGGLKGSVYFNVTYKRPGNTDRNGYQLIIQDPDQWAGSASPFIPLQTEAFLSLQPILFHAMNETRKINPEVRQCLFMDEEGQEDKTLPGKLMRYSFEDCFAECQRKHTGIFCNCTIEVFHPIGKDYPPCKASNFRCLYENAHIFKFTKNMEEDKFVNNSGMGMTCSCLRYCYSLRLTFDMEYDNLFDETYNNIVTFDVSYASETMPYYKTELVMNWLDLLVSFGGIVGLFLGCSLITMVEIFYHFTIGLILYWRKSRSEENFNSYNENQWARKSNKF